MKTRVSLLAAAAALTIAGSASAQICAGFPTMDGQFSLAGVANFPDNIDEFGVEGSYNLAGPLALNAGYLNSSGSDEADEGSANTFIGGVSFDITSLIGTTPAAISLCPTAQFQYTTFSGDSGDDDVSFQAIPVGLGFGTSLPLGVASSLQPYIIPQVVFGRFSGGGASTDWENEFGLRGGVNVTFGQFFVGADVNKLFIDEDEGGSDAVFGVKAGIRL